jgi:hypothetical protein
MMSVDERDQQGDVRSNVRSAEEGAGESSQYLHVTNDINGDAIILKHCGAGPSEH